MYSAKKRDGQKLYELARRGETVERKSVRVDVREFEALRSAGRFLKDNADGTVDLAVRVVCSAGTYVRTLAEALGQRLDVGAHLAELRRTRAGDFSIASAVTLEHLKEKVDDGDLAAILLPPDAALRSMPFVDLTERDVQRVRQGIAIPLSQHSDGAATRGENVRMRDEAGNLVAVACYDAASKSLQPRVVLPPSNRIFVVMSALRFGRWTLLHEETLLNWGLIWYSHRRVGYQTASRPRTWIGKGIGQSSFTPGTRGLQKWMVCACIIRRQGPAAVRQ